MKKLLILMLAGLGGTMLIKNGHVTITPENNVRVVGYTVRLPDAVKNSPLMGLVMTGLMNQAPPPPQTAVLASRPAAAVRPMLPSVTSAANTYSANAPTAHAPNATPTMAADQFNAVAKVLRGSQ
jgi:hypothetical protein